MPETGWVENLTRKFDSWLPQKEVPTPLSFFFRVAGAVTLVVLAALWVSDPNLRYRIFLIGIGMFALLYLGVYLFAWIKPRNLVYRERGHRAEMKFGLGTEKREIGPDEMEALAGTQNPKSSLARNGEA